jgi:two-component system phosphate regulon response regulator OmpR
MFSAQTQEAVEPASMRSLDSHSVDAQRVLVVDDEPQLRALLEEYLIRHGFNVELAADAAQARELFASKSAGDLPQLTILDINMPGEDGFSLARWLRATYPSVGVLMLTTANSTVDRILGLELGADDYLPKPFELRELLARMRAILRRTQVPSAAPQQPASDSGQTSVRAPLHAHATQPLRAGGERGKCVAFGDRVLDLDQHKLFDASGSEIAITAAEFDLLALFARHPNRPLNRDHIMEQAHNRDWDAFDRSIDLRIMRLRRKIERNPDKPEVIKTVRNVGYVFVPSSR